MVPIGVGSIGVSGYPVTFEGDYDIDRTADPGAGGLSITGNQVSVLTDDATSIGVGVGAVRIYGSSVFAHYSRSVPTGNGTVTIAGHTPTASAVMQPGSGSITIAGGQAIASASRSVIGAGPGRVEIIGNRISLIGKQLNVPAGQGANIVLYGYDPTIIATGYWEKVQRRDDSWTQVATTTTTWSAGANASTTWKKI